MGEFKKLKKRRFFRLVVNKLRASFIKDLGDRWAQISLLLLFILWGIMIVPQLEFSKAIKILIGIAVFYLLGKLFFAVRDVRQDEMQAGQWVDGKRLYREPIRIRTEEVQPEMHGKPIRVVVDDAAPNAYVQFSLEHHGGEASGYILSPWERTIRTWARVTQDTSMEAQLNDKGEAILVAYVPDHSSPTDISIDVLSWEWRLDAATAPDEPIDQEYEFLNEPPEELIASLRSTKPNNPFVEITRHDKQSYVIAEGLDTAFTQAGWHHEFKKPMGHANSPYAKFGIEIIGGDPNLVQTVTDALIQNGLKEAKPNSDNSSHPVNKIIIRVGIGK